MPIEFNFVGPPAAVARWSAALDQGRTSATFNRVEGQLVSEGITQLTVDVTGRTPGLQTNFVEAVNPATGTIYLHPDNSVYVDRADGTRGPVPDAATLGHALEHLTSDRVPGDTGGPILSRAGIQEELRAIGTENKITTELGGTPRAENSTLDNFLNRLGVPVLPGSPGINKCFAAGTPILLADGTTKAIEDVLPGDLVFAFDRHVALGCGPLEPRRVTRLYENVTQEWLELSPVAGSERDAEQAGFSSLTVTPGHHFLTPEGQFEEIGEMMARV